MIHRVNRYSLCLTVDSIKYALKNVIRKNIDYCYYFYKSPQYITICQNIRNIMNQLRPSIMSESILYQSIMIDCRKVKDDSLNKK